MEGMEMISFQMVSSAGSARSCFIKAIHKARAGNFDEAKELIEEGQKIYTEGHQVHVGLIQKAAAGEITGLELPLVYAEDLLINAESFGILAEELIETLRLIHNHK
jgi:PTS system cellobiose-specific IIA component